MTPTKRQREAIATRQFYTRQLLARLRDEVIALNDDGTPGFKKAIDQVLHLLQKHGAVTPEPTTLMEILAREENQ